MTKHIFHVFSCGFVLDGYKTITTLLQKHYKHIMINSQNYTTNKLNLHHTINTFFSCIRRKKQRRSYKKKNKYIYSSYTNHYYNNNHYIGNLFLPVCVVCRLRQVSDGLPVGVRQVGVFGGDRGLVKTFTAW